MVIGSGAHSVKEPKIADEGSAFRVLRKGAATMGSKLVSQLEELTDQLLSNADDLVAQSRQHVAVLKDGLARADDAMLRYSKRRQMTLGRNR